MLLWQLERNGFGFKTKKSPLNSLGKKNRHGVSPILFLNGIFEIPLLRNAQNHDK
jgi:hypothetical protein